MRNVWFALATSSLIAVAGTNNSSVAAPNPKPTPTLIPMGDTMLDTSHASIEAEMVGCDIESTDKLLVNGIPPDGAHWDRPIVSPETGISRPSVAFRLSPGYYDLRFSVGNCHFGPFPLIASDIYSHRRITVFALAESSDSKTATPNIANSAGLYGTIPLSGVQVTLEGMDSSCYAARIEDGEGGGYNPQYMYYFDAVKPGRYVLSVAAFGWKRDIGKVDLILPNQAVFHAIDPADISP